MMQHGFTRVPYQFLFRLGEIDQAGLDGFDRLYDASPTLRAHIAALSRFDTVRGGVITLPLKASDRGTYLSGDGTIFVDRHAAAAGSPVDLTHESFHLLRQFQGNSAVIRAATDRTITAEEFVEIAVAEEAGGIALEMVVQHEADPSGVSHDEKTRSFFDMMYAHFPESTVNSELIESAAFVYSFRQLFENPNWRNNVELSSLPEHYWLEYHDWVGQDPPPLPRSLRSAPPIKDLYPVPRGVETVPRHRDPAVLGESLTYAARQRSSRRPETEQPALPGRSGQVRASPRSRHPRRYS
ncbi:hypothetical protein [Pseudosporangium ferrugineum]|uniref:Uncharacterized protein n=1 Tax=Pseudosporangium ferrugineum TaxID=439699 RepID=A0A2T0RQM7_9ACTN|nr:hypothetical protein [Pseudosporangium ferrugineum]PRY23393.1 hypothetical protein CLV70_115126 [Pseudosporangium ferrugineum]